MKNKYYSLSLIILSSHLLLNIEHLRAEESSALECEILMEGEFACYSSLKNPNQKSIDKGRIFYQDKAYPIHQEEYGAPSIPMEDIYYESDRQGYQKTPLLVCGDQSCRQKLKTEFSENFKVNSSKKKDQMNAFSRWSHLTSLIKNVNQEYKPNYVLSDKSKLVIEKLNIELAKLLKEKPSFERDQQADQIRLRISQEIKNGITIAESGILSEKDLLRKNQELLSLMDQYEISEIHWKEQQSTSCSIGWLPHSPKGLDIPKEQLFFKTKTPDIFVELEVIEGKCHVVSERSHPEYKNYMTDEKICEQLENYCQPDEELNPTYESALGKLGLKFNINLNDGSSDLLISYKDIKDSKVPKYLTELITKDKKTSLVIELKNGRREEKLDLLQNPCGFNEKYPTRSPTKDKIHADAILNSSPVINPRFSDAHKLCIKKKMVNDSNEIKKIDPDLKEGTTKTAVEHEK